MDVTQPAILIVAKSAKIVDVRHQLIPGINCRFRREFYGHVAAPGKTDVLDMRR